MREREQGAARLAPVPRLAWLVGVLALVSFAYFSQSGGWNQNTRLDLVRAVTGHGTLRIDALAANTGDRADHAGHVYSDKAPGQPLLALLPTAMARTVLVAAHVDPDSTRGTNTLGYVATVATSAVPAAAGVVLLMWIARRLGASSTAAAVAALSFGLATPMWAYATLLWGHALTVACLLAAFAAAIAGSQLRPRRAGARLAWAV
ncbi:MAG: hypothetical protein JWM05_2731, partial [Acidimicrobiales bacterium]|nr:hypothetical protein [Acidimicrobiales bacterium]